MNGRDIGATYLKQVSDYLESGGALPAGRNGKLNMTELARLAGVPKQSFYKNPGIRKLIERLSANIAAARSSDGTALESSRLRLAESRARRLEQQNAALVAENAELRRQLKAARLSFEREEMMIDTGRRVASPDGS